MTVDPIYINAAIETLELIHQLHDFLKENQKVNELSNHLSQIEVKANAKTGSYLGRKLDILNYSDDQEGKPTEYWKGVRDMASYAIKQWNRFQDEQKFVTFLKTTRSSLLASIAPNKQVLTQLEEILKNTLRSDDESTDDGGLESPAAIPEVIPIKEEDHDIEDISDDQHTPQDTSHPDSPPIKSSFPTSSLPGKLLDDNDESLSSTLKDALRILRDEVDNEKNG